MKQKNIWHWLGLIGAIFAVFGAIFYLFSSNLFSEGMMRGGDEAAHMFIPKYVVDYFKNFHYIPRINPFWYNGIETLHHTPIMTYIPVAIIYILTKDIYLTNRVITLLLLLFGGFSMFFLLYKNFSIKSALIGGVLFPLAPIVFYLIRTSITRATPYVLIPLLFYYLNQVLEKKFTFWNLFMLTVLFSISILAHPIYAISSTLCLFLYAIIRLILEKEIGFKKFTVVLVSFLLSCGLVAWFALPFLLEPAGFGSRISAELLQGLRYGLQIKLILTNGAPLIILAALSFILRRRTTKDWALLISVIFASLLATGIAVPFYNIFPWVYPYSTLIWVVFGIIYWASTIFESSNFTTRIKLPLQIIIIPLIIISSLFYFNKENQFYRNWTINFEKAFPELTETLKKIDNPGRVLTVKNVGELDWIIPAITKKYYSEGHYFSITRLNKEIAWIGDALDNDYSEYVIKKMRLFNNRYFVVTKNLNDLFENNPSDGLSFYQMLEDEGFEPVFVESKKLFHALYYQDKPSSYLIPLKEKTLVIGKHSYNYAAFQPNSYIAGSNYLDDYDLEFLKHFDNLVLYGFGYRDKAKAERLIRDFSREGGNVVIDMLNIENSKLAGDPTFLGVKSTLEITKSPMKLEFNENYDNELLPSVLNIPEIKDFGLQGISVAKLVPLKEWRFTNYLNLDGSIVRWNNRDEEDNGAYDLIGYKNIDGNKVWFIGGNLFYHAYLTHNQNEQDFIRKITIGDESLIAGDEPKIDIYNQNLDPEAGIMKFNYIAEKNTPLLVSYTTSPHWKAYVNGEPVKIYNIDSMMALNLPAGNNSVKLVYEKLSLHYFAYGITLTTIILLVVIFYFYRKRKNNVQKS